MNILNPSSIYAPFAQYAHGVEIAPGARLVVCSGQLGVKKDGSIPPDAERQTEVALANVEAILREAGMDRRHIVRFSAFVTGREHLAGYMAARDRFISDLDNPPASTLMIVSGFARPELLVEVEVIAAEEV
ncbi:MAG: RidA family protein [Pseudomonadota bacterium]